MDNEESFVKSERDFPFTASIIFIKFIQKKTLL